MNRKRARKLLLIPGLFLAGLLLLWFSLPFWFPWVLRPLAGKYGARYQQYERQGYSRFALDGLSFTNRSTVLQAQRVEALAPSVWLWRCFLSKQNQDEPFVRVANWDFEALPSTRTNASSSSTFRTTRDIESILKSLQRWVPKAVLSNGTVRVQQTLISIPASSWSRGVLNAQVETVKPAQKATIVANFGNPPPYEIQLDSDSLNLQSTILVSTELSALNVQSKTSWWSNRVDLRAQFGPRGVLPDSARLVANTFRIPPQALKLPYYEDITGSLSAEWQQGQFALDLRAASTPLSSETNLPPLNLDLHARGNTNSAVVESAVISSPWLKAELSRYLHLNFRGQLLREPAALKLAGDLSKQPWLPLKGLLQGEANFTPTNGKFPEAEFRLSGSEIGNSSLTAKALRVNGNFSWPALHLKAAEADFEDGSTFSADGTLDVPEKTIAEGHVSFTGGLVRRWLPTGYGCENVLLKGTFNGPVKELLHSGHLEATEFTSPQLRPLQITFDWAGKQVNLSRAEAKLTAEKSSLSLGGSLQVGSNGTNLLLSTLTLLTNSEPVLELQQSCRISVARSSAAPGWQVATTPFYWSGKAGSVQAQGTLVWPQQADLRASVQRMHSTLLADFLKTNFATFEIRKLDAAAGWTNGPASFDVDLFLANLVLPRSQIPGKEVGTPLNLPLSAQLTLSGNQQGIVLSNLNVSSQTSSIVIAHGLLPVQLDPSHPTNTVRFDAEKPLQLIASTQPHAFFWDQLASATGVRLRNPALNLNLAGTWKAPQGTVQMHADQIEIPKMRRPMPSLNNLDLTLQLDRQQARITDFRLLVQRQPVTLSAQLPLGETFWTNLQQKKPPDWQKVSARLRIEDAELAPLAELYPKLLSPQGELNVDVALSPGGKLDGTLTVERARTRPLPNLGPLRDISVHMNFVERELKLQRASANVGGAAVSVTGQADLRGTNWFRGALPPFHIAIRGTNVPLSRQTDAIIRSDLNLAVVKTNGASPVISGDAQLQNSYFLADIRPLAPGKVATPRRRPPYFSIEDPLLADWRLGVHAKGERFLKVSSSIFVGEVSANINLQGTLKDPIAIGDVKIDSGVVRFPFANLDVKQGFVTLSSQDPYRPQLSVLATSRQFGYDIKMEVSGPADAPVLQFTSTPPLGSEQILLMVTAGELPGQQQALSTQQRAQTFALFLGRDLLSKLGLGNETQQRLTIRSGAEMTEQGRPTYDAEYKLTDRWSVTGEYDRFNDFNVGLKWRVYSK